MHWRAHFTGRPASLLALAAGWGVVLADFTAALPGALWIAGVCGAFAASLMWCRSKGLWALLLVTSAFAWLHMLELGKTRLHPLRLTLESRRDASLEVTATGRVEQPLRHDMPGTEAGEALFIAQEIMSPTTGKRWTGPTRLQLYPGKEVALSPGEYRVRGYLRLPPPPDNPGQFDARAYQLRLGLVAQLQASHIECLRADSWNLDAALIRVADRCRAWVTETLSADLADRPRERAIILAMALGHMEEGAKELETPFRESGTLHIFAVSGLHVVIVGFILMLLLRPLGFRRSVLAVILILALFGYAFLTGLRPSAIRAAFMSSVVLIGMGLHRHTDLLNSLGVAALLLVALDTQQIFAPGFQLSFFVIAAIALLADRFTKPLRPWIEPDPFMPKPLLAGHQKLLWSVRRGVAGLFTVSAAAGLGSLPLIFAHFHLVTPVTLLSNVLLVPLSFLVLGTAMLTLLFGALRITILQAWLSNANLAFAWASLHCAQFFAGIPLGNFHLPEPSLTWRPPAELTVLRLTEGGGAQHLRVGSWDWLLDTGSEEHFIFRVRPYLHQSGVNHLDGVILSHSDYEHIGAATRVQHEFGAPPVWMSGREPWRWDAGGSTLRMLATQGLNAFPLAQGATINLGHFSESPALATVLHPPPDIWPRRGDDRCLVLRLDLGPHRILWCSDSGFVAEKSMLRTLPREALRCAVLIRNQHPDDFSLLPEFLDAVQPRMIISSNDDFPIEQMLPQSLREACSQRGITLYDQAETGAVMLRFWPERLEVRTMRGSGPPVVIPVDPQPRK